ncbi:MAG: hypothetical protein K2N05_09540 [Muribaculaceae bacterium]|nr:hypothetical protein [Muribaculaceae bacterium]
MKKFFLLLAVALPMLFTMTACGDDDDTDILGGDIEFKMPVLTKNASGVLQISNNSIDLDWGDTIGEVKSEMSPFSYVLQSETSTNLGYTYDADYGYPFYTYAFAANRLASSAITITETQDDEINVIKYLEDNGYKDVSKDDEEDVFVYRSKDKLTVVYYGFDGDITIMWTPNDGTRADNWRAELNKHLELVNSVRK